MKTFRYLVAAIALPAAAEVLYNGIVLPPVWPPQAGITQLYRVPPYLLSPPAVIPIDTGRQLFVDDFLIEQTTLTRTAHRPAFYPLNPVLAPGGPDTNGLAIPISDGVWFDPADRLFKMWYMGGYLNMISYAYSTDGRNWIKPAIPDAVVPGTNMVLQIGGGRDSTTVWMDLEDNPARKFKAFARVPPSRMNYYYSADGIHWSPPQSNYIESISDRTTLFWNPFRRVWVDSMRSSATLPAGITRPSYRSRVRWYGESPDLVTWTPADFWSSYWTGPDENDPPYAGPGGAFPELYNLDAVAYESLLVGMFSWFHPGPDYGDYNPGPTLVELGVGFSRDGFYWVRPTRGSASNAFIPASNAPGTWDAYNTQSAGGCFLVVGDELWFYFSGRDAKKPANGIGSTGLAMLRRDGFYSMDAGAAEGVLTTRPVTFSGSRLFVNVDDPNGQLKAEILDTAGNVIAPFSKANSIPMSANKTLQELNWTGVADLSSLAGRPVKFRFYLTSGRLYAFWVAPDSNGASRGYVAAGGPGFTGVKDTLGKLSSPGTAGTPVIYLDGGMVAMLTGTLGASIRYTVDGSEPSALSTLYTAPFPLPVAAPVKAKAFATGLSPSATAVFTLSADHTPPTVNLTSPAAGSVLTGQVAVSATATDNVGVSWVQFTLDGANLGTRVLSLPYSTTLDAATLTVGPHTLGAVAGDAAGNAGTAASVGITIPAGGGVSAIGINFVGRSTSMAATESAGVILQTNWNNASGAARSTPLALMDATGRSSGATVVWSCDLVWSTAITGSAGNGRMMQGYLDTLNNTPTTVTVAGLPAGAMHNIYVYTDGYNSGASRTASYQISGPGIATVTVNAVDASGVDFNGTFTQAAGTAGNYVKFTVTGTSFTLTARPVSSTDPYPRSPVNGIQILSTPTTTDFALSALPATQTVVAGGSAAYTASVSGLNGFTGSVALAISGLPPGATAGFNPASITGTGSSTLTVTPASTTPAGNYTLTVFGTGGGLSRTATVSLTVNAVPSSASAAIGVNFVGRDTTLMSPTESAGVIPQTHWNSAPGAANSAPLALADANGTPTGATLTWSCDLVWSLPITASAGNSRLMLGYLDTLNNTPTTVNVAGLPASAAGYDVYVYTDGDNRTASRTGTYQVSGPGIAATSVTATDAPGTNFSGAFAQAAGTAGNYLKFTVTGTAFTLTARPVSSTDVYLRSPVNAIQIVPR